MHTYVIKNYEELSTYQLSTEFKFSMIRNMSNNFRSKFLDCSTHEQSAVYSKINKSLKRFITLV